MTEATVTYAVKDYKNKGQWKEKNSSGRGIHTSIFNACSSETFCQNPALRFAVVPKQEQKDDAL